MSRPSIFPRVVSLLALCCPVHAQDWGPWSLIGPFDHPAGATDIAEVYPLERELKRMGFGDGEGPRLGLAQRGKGGASITWTELPGSAGRLDVGVLSFPQLLGPAQPSPGWSDRAVAYLYRRVVCARPVEVAVSMGSDDGLRFWLNGELLVDRAVPRGLNVMDHGLVLQLQAGVNHLLVKVANGGGAWSYQLAGWAKVPQASIDSAIDRGVQMLLRHQLVDGSWAGHEGYGSGLSAYAGYCLLKCGLSATHPAVRRARAYALANPSPFTYSKSCELLLLCELGEPELLPQIESRLDELLDWQDGSGLWAYPVYPGGSVLPVDLSNTLYAALAFRSCEKLGLRIPARAWGGLLAGTLRCFEGLERRGRGGAGFSYRPDGQVTGSMTTAGLTVIEICTHGLGGDLPAKYRAPAARARAAGLDWLALNTSWGQNPGQGGAHHYFFIYGMERVGSLLGLELLGGLNWYWDGAGWLVKAQLGSGGWVGDESTIDTILALLFLKRASAPSTGGDADGDSLAKSWARNRWVTEDPAASVSLAATGGARAALWIVGFNDELRARLEFPGESGRGPRVESVRYLARPAGEGEFESIGEVSGRPELPASGERFPLAYEFPRAGEWEVRAQVRVWVPPAAEGLQPGREDLSSPVLRLRIADVLIPEQLQYARQGRANLLHGAKLTAAASSQVGDQGPGRAVDGSQGTRWFSEPADRTPWLRLSLPRPIKGNLLLLSHAFPRASHTGDPRPERVEVILNGRARFELTLDPDPMLKTALRFERLERVRELELRVLSVGGGELGSASVGFAEVEFLRMR
jgi:hypothetical protein